MNQENRSPQTKMQDTIIERKDSQLFARLLGYSKPFWLLLIVALVCMLFSTTLNNLRPRIIQISIDNYLTAPSKNVSKSKEKISEPSGKNIVEDSSAKEKKNLNIQERKDGLKKMVLFFALTIICSAILGFCQTYLLNKVSQNIIFNIREELFDHIKSRSLLYFSKQPIGRLVTRVTNDTQSLNEMFINVLASLVSDFFSVIVIIVLMFQLDVKLSLVMFSVLPFIFIATLIFQKKIRLINRKAKGLIAKINSSLNEYISGMKIIQIFKREKKVFADFDNLNFEYLTIYKKGILMRAIFRPSVQMMKALGLAGIVYFGLGDVIKGVIPFGVFYAFTEYLERVFMPILNFTESLDSIQDAISSGERIFTILDDKSEIKNPETPIEINGVKGKIEFRNVSFSYDGITPVLKNINFTINPGETFAFVGATGAGKSSIMNLLTRFYDCQEGEILIDDINIKDLDKYKLRKFIACVQQDVFMFTGTISENISLGDKNITDEKIIQAAKYVNASKFIEKLPSKYDEPVMERGATLSNGERQLLSFARALVVQPQVLILDEATSSVDTETELLIQDALKKLLGNRTSLTVAHRLSTIQNADKIIVLDHGEIVEFGNHQELLAKKGFYYRLYELQYKEDKI